MLDLISLRVCLSYTVLSLRGTYTTWEEQTYDVPKKFFHSPNECHCHRSYVCVWCREMMWSMNVNYNSIRKQFMSSTYCMSRTWETNEPIKMIYIWNALWSTIYISHTRAEYVTTESTVTGTIYWYSIDTAMESDAFSIRLFTFPFIAICPEQLYSAHIHA